MSSYYVQDSSFFSRRAVALGAIIVLHILVIWAFASGLATNATKYVQTIIQTSIIQQDKPKVQPPPPPPPKLQERPPVQVVAPVVDITVPTEAPPITNTTTRPVAKAPPPAPVVRRRPEVRVAPRSRRGFPNSEDYYPSASQRANEEGSPIIQYCVEPNGKLGTVTVTESSKFQRLDDAAVKLVQAAAPFVPGTVDGKAVEMCNRVRITFKITQ